jgi:hypothetical protein
MVAWDVDHTQPAARRTGAYWLSACRNGSTRIPRILLDTPAVHLDSFFALKKCAALRARQAGWSTSPTWWMRVILNAQRLPVLLNGCAGNHNRIIDH